MDVDIFGEMLDTGKLNGGIHGNSSHENHKMVYINGDVYLRLVNCPVLWDSDITSVSSVWVKRISGDDYFGRGRVVAYPYIFNVVETDIVIEYRLNEDHNFNFVRISFVEGNQDSSE